MRQGATGACASDDDDGENHGLTFSDISEIKGSAGVDISPPKQWRDYEDLE